LDVKNIFWRVMYSVSTAWVEMLQLLKSNSSGVVMNYQFACSGISQLLLLNIQVFVVRTNCKRAAPLTLYVHIVVIAGSSFFYCLASSFSPWLPFCLSKMCLGGGVPRHIFVVPIHSLDSGIWVHSWYCWKFLCEATFIRTCQ
jgi:hypothetical protein